MLICVFFCLLCIFKILHVNSNVQLTFFFQLLFLCEFFFRFAKSCFSGLS